MTSTQYRVSLNLSIAQLKRAITYLEGTVLPRLKNEQRPPDEEKAPEAKPAEKPVSSLQEESNIVDTPRPVVNARIEKDPRFLKVFESSKTEHKNKSVQAAVHVPFLPGLEQCELGWLISSSEGILNLWRCGNLDGNDAFGPLFNMHSLSFDYKIHNFDIMDWNNTKLLLGSASGTTLGSGAVLLLSLDSSSLFAPKGRVLLPTNKRITEAISLSSFGGPLSTCVASAAGNDFYVHDLSSGVASPKASITAHSDTVSCLSVCSPLSLFGIATGSMDGSVHLWDMRKPPKNPTQRLMGHDRLVTGIESVRDYSVITSSTDSSVLFWDLRNAQRPTKEVVVDGNGVLSLSQNPERNKIAISTLKTVWVMDYDSCDVSCLSNTDNMYPITVWNQVRGRGGLYCGDLDGGISVFKSKHSMTRCSKCGRPIFGQQDAICSECKNAMDGAANLKMKGAVAGAHLPISGRTGGNVSIPSTGKKKVAPPPPSKPKPYILPQHQNKNVKKSPAVFLQNAKNAVGKLMKSNLGEAKPGSEAKIKPNEVKAAQPMTKKDVITPSPHVAVAAPPPPGPPQPPAGGGSAPPPPPPAMPGTGELKTVKPAIAAPPPPPSTTSTPSTLPPSTPGRNALLGQIQKGKKLKKSKTRDASAPAVGSGSGGSSSGGKGPGGSKGNAGGGPMAGFDPGAALKGLKKRK